MSSTAVTVAIVTIALMVAILMAILIAYVTATLSRADGSSYPAAFMRAGVAFAGTLTLIAALTSVIAGLLA